MAVFNNERMDVCCARHGDDFCVIEHEATGTFPGGFGGVPDNGRAGSPSACSTCSPFGAIGSVKNVWLDVGSIVAQLQA